MDYFLLLNKLTTQFLRLVHQHTKTHTQELSQVLSSSLSLESQNLDVKFCYKE